MKKLSRLIFIRPFTNMHVGSGKNINGKVDDQIQRDVLTGHPIIHSTSLKGAFKELLCDYLPAKEMEVIFGKGDDDSSSGRGQYDFFNACLLTYPLRSNKIPYFNATSPQLINDFLRKIDILGVSKDTKLYDALEKLGSLEIEKNTPMVFDKKLKDAIIEYHYIKSVACDNSLIKSDIQKLLTEFLGTQLAIFNDEDLSLFLKNKLPVIARNYLENGQSKNVWYEEVVPRESLFYTAVSSPEGMTVFYDALSNVRQMQIGDNSTVGYGYCKINVQKRNSWKA